MAETREPAAGCELCGRQAYLTFHHLIPRRNHRKARYRKAFSRGQMKQRGLWLCRLCHRQIHRFYSHEELGWSLNTREALLEQPEVLRFVRWARKQR